MMMRRFLLAVIALAAVAVSLAAAPALASRPAVQVSPFTSTFVVISGPPRVVELCRVTATDPDGQIREITCRRADFEPIAP